MRIEFAPMEDVTDAALRSMRANDFGTGAGACSRRTRTRYRASKPSLPLGNIVRTVEEAVRAVGGEDA